MNYIRLPDDVVQTNWHWAIRYTVMLWLSLICKIPFNLSQFDEPGHIGETAAALEELGKKYLDRAGLEREAAASLLSRLYMRYARWGVIRRRGDFALTFHNFTKERHGDEVQRIRSMGCGVCHICRRGARGAFSCPAHTTCG